MFKRLSRRLSKSRAKTVEIYGWIIFSKAGCFCSSRFHGEAMHFGPLTPQASGFLRLIGMLFQGSACSMS